MRRPILIFAIAAVIQSCSDIGIENKPKDVSDVELVALARAPQGWQYYKLSSDTLSKAPASAHDEARLRTRYNSKAATQLDAVGKVRLDAIFPDSSLIVKELFTGSRITTIAIMFKLRSAPNAGAGWVWAEIGTDGGVKVSTASKGTGCTSCHGAGIDFTRMNDAHP